MELLISNIQKEKFAFYLENIQEVIEKSSVEELPNSPEFLEGLFNYRERVIPVFNLRKLMNLKSFHEEQCLLLNNTKKAHKEWIDSLKNSLEKNTPFNKELDSSKCVLGKWIDENLKCMKCNNKGYVNLIKNHLVEPHTHLHSLAGDLLENKDESKIKEIEEVYLQVDNALNLLHENISLLTNAFQKVVIYKLNERIFGVAIDDIDRIVNVEKDNFKSADIITKSSFLSAENVVELDNKIILVLEFNQDVLDQFDNFKAEEELD